MSRLNGMKKSGAKLQSTSAENWSIHVSVPTPTSEIEPVNVSVPWPVPGGLAVDQAGEVGESSSPVLLFLIRNEAVNTAVAPGGVLPDQVEADPGPRLLVLARQRAAPVDSGLPSLVIATHTGSHSP
jgi:hypothetical protein